MNQVPESLQDLQDQIVRELDDQIPQDYLDPDYWLDSDDEDEPFELTARDEEILAEHALQNQVAYDHEMLDYVLELGAKWIKGQATTIEVAEAIELANEKMSAPLRSRLTGFAEHLYFATRVN